VWETLVSWNDFTGTIAVVLVIAGITAGISASFKGLPWWVSVAVFLLLFFYGLLRATFEEVTEVRGEAGRAKQERDQERRKIQKVEARLATDKKRADFKDALAAAHREGKRLHDINADADEVNRWGTHVYRMVENAVGQG
jgi:ABC-type nickel/cobalt efflux system permease component RcnA